MLHRILTILSLIGLLLSVGLWGASYWRMSWVSSDYRSVLYLVDGWFGYLQSQSPSLLKDTLGQKPGAGRAEFGFDYGETDPFQSPVVWRSSAQIRSLEVALYLPLGLFAVVWLIFRGFELRYHRRKKLGLCLECGYNLKGLTEPRCPECGTAFEMDRPRLQGGE